MSGFVTTTSKQDEVLSRLAEAGFSARWWGRGDAAERIYLNGHGWRDAKVYLGFDDPAECEGAALRVWIGDCGQHAKWYRAERQKLMERFDEAFAIASGMKEAEAATEAVTEAAVEEMKPGQRVEFVTGGTPDDDNDERAIVGEVVEVRCEPTPADMAANGEYVRLVVSPQDGGGNYELYTWRGLLRYGSGAQVVRWADKAGKGGAR